MSNMFCNQCGRALEPGSQFCAGCGKAVQITQTVTYYGQPGGQMGHPNQTGAAPINTYFDNAPSPEKQAAERNLFLWGLFAFWLGPFGFILYYSSRQMYPKRAKVVLVCSIIGTVFSFIYLGYLGDQEAAFQLLRFLAKS